MDEKNSEAIEFVNSVNNFTVYAGRLIFQLPLWKIYPTKDWKIFVKSTKCAYEYTRLIFSIVILFILLDEIIVKQENISVKLKKNSQKRKPTTNKWHPLFCHSFWRIKRKRK